MRVTSIVFFVLEGEYKQTCLCAIVLCSISAIFTLHNHNEQFYQVGLLDRAFGLDLIGPSSRVLQAPLYLRTYGAK